MHQAIDTGQDIITLLPLENLGEKFWSDCMPLDSHRLAVALVLNLAADKGNVKAVHEAQTKAASGHAINMELISKYSSASLREEFSIAQAAACECKTTTVLGVQIVDVAMLELTTRKGHAVGSRYSSFMHSFALAIGPEGSIIWQAGSIGRYTMVDWAKNGGARLRDSKEMEDFLGDFERLFEEEVRWMLPHNCFLLSLTMLNMLADICLAICRKSEASPPASGTPNAISGTNVASTSTSSPYRRPSLFYQTSSPGYGSLSCPT